MRLYRELRLPRSTAQVLITLADLNRIDGTLEHAHACLEEAVGMTIHVGEKLGLQHALDTYAELALEEGLPHRAARLAGAAARLRQEMGMLSWPVIRPRRWERAAAMAAGSIGQAKVRLERAQ